MEKKKNEEEDQMNFTKWLKKELQVIRTAKLSNAEMMK